MDRKLCSWVVLFLAFSSAGHSAESETVTLETVRAMVARNEALLNPIKMAYTVKKSQTGERPQQTRGPRLGRSYSHVNCIWAQVDQKHFAREDYFFASDELASSTVKVIEPEGVTEGVLHDLMQGYIYPRDDHDWDSVPVAKLGLRPFEGHYTLSRILVPQYSTVHKDIGIVDGHDTYVIDAKRPSVYPSFARIWIDRQRGMPLRIWYYGKHPNWSNQRSMSQINDIKLHQLQNGAWIPVEGVRSINFSDEYISYEHVIVDVKSITTQREDIPESLFKIDFPQGAVIYDTISGLTSVIGRPLKTYEQIVNAGNTFIAGTVVDEEDSPASGVVVGPLSVKTKQADGRFSLKFIQVLDRPCAITDSKGRFAIELDEEGLYELLVLADDFVDMRVRDVPQYKHDLKVTINKGGVVTGHVVRLMTGGKVPVAHVEVTAEEGNKVNRATFRPHRMKTKTDSEGMFQIKCLDTLIPERRTSNSPETHYVPRSWQIRCGSTSETVWFEDGKNTQQVELVLKPDLQGAVPLIGRTLPDFDDIKIILANDQNKEKNMLVCFFDMNQRPSRNYIIQLGRQAELLERKGISLAAVQAVKMDEITLTKWISDNKISFPIGMIRDNEECVRFDWAVQSLPWLILTDNKHIVTAEGFAVGELDSKLKTESD